MVGWLATQYQRLAAKAERDGQYSAAVGALNALGAMVVQPQLDAQFADHFRGRFTHQRTAGSKRCVHARGQYSQHRHWDTGAATHVLNHPLVIRWFYASQRVITVPS